MKPWILKIGYWILVITGVCPLTLNKSKPSGTIFPERIPENYSWNPWTISRYGHIVGFVQAFLIIFDCSMKFVRRIQHSDGVSLSQEYLGRISYAIEEFFNRILTVFLIIMIISRRKKILLTINDICSIYFNVNKSVVPPPNRLFKPVIIFAVITIFACMVKIVTSLIYIKFSDLFQFLFWIIDADYTVFYTEIGSAVALTYLKTSISAGLNDDIKKNFSIIGDSDSDIWDHRNCRKIKKGFLINARPLLKKYRTTYRSISEVIKKINSTFGSIYLFSIIFNQTITVVMGFGFHSKILDIFYYEIESEKKFEAYIILIYLGTSFVWYFARIIFPYHCFQMVIKEIQLTASLIAALDSSKIDADSKIELMEFLEEIDGIEIRFNASGIMTLDYLNLHSVLYNGITLAIIVVQYLYL